MKRFPLAIAAAIACSIGTTSALAQERGYRRDAGPAVQKHYRDGGRRDWGGNRSHHYPRYGYAPRYRSAPYLSLRYYGSPGSVAWGDPLFYAAPVYAYPYPVYEPEPLIVERVYVDPPRRFYEAEPPRERSYAQVDPPKAAPSAPAQPVPRLERYTLSAKELFEFDKATLRQPQPRLDEIAAALQNNPQIDDVTITGHTDRLGTQAYNQQLSQRRADAVKAYLVGSGVAASRLKAVGKGESQPVVECKDAPQAELIKCLEPNRRVEVEQITIERRVR